MEVLPSLAKRRLTDFFEGAGENGRRETLYALFWGRRLMVLLVWMLCQGAIGMFTFFGPQECWRHRALGVLIISLILAASCLGVVWKDWCFARSLTHSSLDAAWRRARDRSVTRLAVFSLSLVVGGAVAMFCSATPVYLG
jgi:hypothetical protein